MVAVRKDRGEPDSGAPLSIERCREALYFAVDSAVSSHDEQGHVALIALDINRFREFNIALGNRGGDEILRQVADRLLLVLRPDDHLFRVGDDEFAILLNPVYHPDHIGLAVHKIRSLFESPVVINKENYPIRFAVGAASFPDSAADAPTLIRHSQFALHRAKQHNEFFVLYDASFEADRSAVETFSYGLKRALDANELNMVYQPIFDVRDNCMVAVEALVRWHRPRQGVVMPDRIIPVAEETGLIRQLSVWALNTAIRECAEFEDLKISVNISAYDLDDPGFVDVVRRAVYTWRLDPTRLCLELTETAMMADPDNTAATLNELAEFGVNLSIDDFGSGYSSLQYLNRLPVHNIKIDKEFVVGVNLLRGDTRIIEAVTSLGHSFGLTVTAEGVETGEALAVVENLGCDLAQGYHLARPMDLEAVGKRWLEDRPPAPRIQHAYRRL